MIHEDKIAFNLEKTKFICLFQTMAKCIYYNAFWLVLGCFFYYTEKLFD